MQTPGKLSGPFAPAKSLRRGVLNVHDGMRHVPSRGGRALFARLPGMRGHALRRLRATRTGPVRRLRSRRQGRINPPCTPREARLRGVFRAAARRSKQVPRFRRGAVSRAASPPPRHGPGRAAAGRRPRRTLYAGAAASRARGERSINQVYSPFQPSFTVPSAPLRCLAMMISAMFFSAVSGS